MNIGLFKKRVTELINVRTPVIWVSTREEEMAEREILKIAISRKACKYFYVADDTMAIRVDPLTGKGTTAEELQGLDARFTESIEEFEYKDVLMGEMEALRLLEECPDSTMLIIRNLSSVRTSMPLQRRIYNLSIRAMHQERTYVPIVFIMPTPDVPEMLREATVSVNLPLATEKENAAYIKAMAAREGVELEATPTETGRAATGLTLFQVRQAMADSVEQNGKISPKVLNATRILTVKQGGLLTYVEPKRTLDDIGGHQAIKRWILETKKCMTPEARAFGIRQTKGMIALGIAGTGKSLIAEAIANCFGMPMVNFDLSRIMGGLVGQSERTARKAFETIDALGECVVFMDEVDKKFAGSSSDGSQDGGTFARVFDIILENLQNNSRQFYVMAANDVSRLPSALMRAGRLDTKWFFDFPDKADRESIFRIYFRKAGKNVPDALIKIATSLSENFTGAEVETAVNNILKTAFLLHDGVITREAVAEGIALISPVYRTNRDEVEELQGYARKNGIPATSIKKEQAIPSAISKERIRSTDDAIASTVA